MAQDKQNQEALSKMEANHFAEVEEIKEVYEKKLYQKQSEYLSLEQSKLELKKHYECKIDALKAQNSASIQKLL